VPAAMRWNGTIAPGTATDEMLHAIDLLPTFCGLAGADAKKGLPLDGVDAWGAIARRERSPRQEIVHSLDVLRAGDWKLIEKGATYYTWEEQPLQLYNIREDPYEKRDLAAARPAVVAKLRERLAYHKKFKREEEPPARIPNHPPAVYGEEENREHGEWVGKEMQRLRVREREAKQKGEQD
jgi:arylsulfatase A-like enzyme